MKITIRKTWFRGQTRWCVDRMEGGKRRRTFFATKLEAETEKASLERQIMASGATWMTLSGPERSEVAAVMHEVKALGLSLRTIWEAFKNGATGGNLTPRTLEQAVNETLEAKIAAKRRPVYVQSLREYLGHFMAGRKLLGVDKITPGEIERWFVERKEAPSTRASNLGRLSSMFDLCFRRDYIAVNPCHKVERVTVETGQPMIFTVAQARKLMETCQTHEKTLLPFLTLGMFAGIRPGECKGLKWGDVDLEMKRVTIHQSIAKKRHWRHVPLAPAAVAWLKRCDPKKPFTPKPQALSCARRRLCVRAEIKWHHNILRKTAASYLMAAHQDAQKVSEWLGNSPTILRRHYRELVAPEEAEKFWKILPK